MTGRVPYDTLAQVVRHVPFPSPRELSTAICPELEAVVLRALEGDVEARWPSVAAMREAFDEARSAQLTFRVDPLAASTVSSQRGVGRHDWSSRVLELMAEESWREAEATARSEYQASGDIHAYLLMVRCALRDGRYFDAAQMIDSDREILTTESRVTGDLEQLALEAFLRTERVRDAELMVNRCLERQGSLPGLLLRKASLLGLQARFPEAAELLLQLNRMLPRREAILKRLVMVHEQLRDAGKAEAFRRVLEKLDGTAAAAADEVRPT